MLRSLVGSEMCIRDSFYTGVRMSIVSLRMQTSGRFPSLTHAYVSDEQGAHLTNSHVPSHPCGNQEEEISWSSVPSPPPRGYCLYVSLSQPAPLSMCAYKFGDDVCCVSYGSVHLSVCCVCHVCVCTLVTSSSRDTSGASNHFRLEWNIGRSNSPFFPSISCRNPTENLQPVFLNR